MHVFNRSKLKTIFFLLLLILIRSNQLWATTNSVETEYTINIQEENIKKAVVECYVKVEDSLLFMSSIGANQFPK